MGLFVRARGFAGDRPRIGAATFDGSIGPHCHHGLGGRDRHADRPRDRVSHRDVRGCRRDPRQPCGRNSEDRGPYGDCCTTGFWLTVGGFWLTVGKP